MLKIKENKIKCMKKLAIFDFDGTLFNSVDDVVKCLNEALTIYGFPTLTREEYIGKLGGDIDEIVSLVLKDNDTPEYHETFKNTYLKIYYGSEKENTLPFPGSHEILKTLQSKEIPLAINSNRFTDSLEFFVNKFFGDIDFLLIEGHNYDTPTKPSPAGINKIIEKAGVSRDDAIYIGDSSTDILTAQNAGIDCIIVKWGYGNEKDLENDYILDAIEDASEILNYF